MSQPVLQIVLNGLLEREWLVTHGDRTQIYSLNKREREAVERFIAESGERLDG